MCNQWEGRRKTVSECAVTRKTERMRICNQWEGKRKTVSECAISRKTERTRICNQWEGNRRTVSECAISETAGRFSLLPSLTRPHLTSCCFGLFPALLSLSMSV